MAKQPNSVSSGGESFMVKLSTFIVDKRNLFFLITIILVIFSMFSRNWVEVENAFHQGFCAGAQLMAEVYMNKK